MHLQKCFAYLGCKQDDFPEPEKPAKEVIVLPVYPEPTNEMKNRVIKNVLEILS